MVDGRAGGNCRNQSRPVQSSCHLSRPLAYAHISADGTMLGPMHNMGCFGRCYIRTSGCKDTSSAPGSAMLFVTSDQPCRMRDSMPYASTVATDPGAGRRFGLGGSRGHRKSLPIAGLSPASWNVHANRTVEPKRCTVRCLSYVRPATIRLLVVPLFWAQFSASPSLKRLR